MLPLQVGDKREDEEGGEAGSEVERMGLTPGERRGAGLLLPPRSLGSTSG